MNDHNLNTSEKLKKETAVALGYFFSKNLSIDYCINLMVSILSGFVTIGFLMQISHFMEFKLLWLFTFFALFGMFKFIVKFMFYKYKFETILIKGPFITMPFYMIFFYVSGFIPTIKYKNIILLILFFIVFILMSGFINIFFKQIKNLINDLLMNKKRRRF